MRKVKYLLIFIIVFLIGSSNAKAYSIREDNNYTGVNDNQIQIRGLNLRNARIVRNDKPNYYKIMNFTKYTAAEYGNGKFNRERTQSDKVTYNDMKSETGDKILVYTGKLTTGPANDLDYVSLRWDDVAITEDGVPCDVEVQFGFWIKVNKENTKPILLISNTSNGKGLDMNARYAKQEVDYRSDAGTGTHNNEYFEKHLNSSYNITGAWKGIGSHINVKITFYRHGTNTKINGKKVSFHFTGLNQPDRTVSDYWNGDYNEKYAESIVLKTKGNNPVPNGDVYIKTGALNRWIARVNHNDGDRFKAVSENSDGNQTGFYTWFNSDRVEFDWYGSDCTTNIGFNYKTSFGKNDYSLDAACLGCDEDAVPQKREKSKAFIIQDTTDWDSILVSDTIKACGSNNDFIHTYFKRSGGIFCREEYHVYYPDITDKIKVHLGRYFTLNATEDQLKVIDGSIPNYIPVKSVKIRQCLGARAALESFERSSKDSFVNDGGTVRVNYEHDNNDGKFKYNYEDDLNSSSSNYITKYTNNYKGNLALLEQKADYSYTLKDGVYSNIMVGDGTSQKTPNQSYVEDGVINDVKVSNFPVLRNATKEPKVTFKFSLPRSDSNSKMYQVLGNSGANGVKNLKCASNSNVYNTGDSSNLYEGTENIDNSACAKMFDKNKGSRYNTCVNSRKNNDANNSKIGNCYNLITNNYYCYLDIDSDNRCNKSTVGTGSYSNYVWAENRCCEISKYDRNTGKCNDNPCNSSNYSSLGRDWNPTSGKCCPSGSKYDAVNKMCDKCGSSHLACAEADRPCCEDANGEYYCGYYVDGKEVCPGRTDSDAIYRVINTRDPFIAQNGAVRETGGNWCSNSAPAVNHFTCAGKSSDNPVVRTVITDKEAENKEPMYVVELNGDTINAIRDYNKGKTYEDFRLSCKSDGSACKSEFLKSEFFVNGGKVSGRCANTTKADFYKC